MDIIEVYGRLIKQFVCRRQTNILLDYRTVDPICLGINKYPHFVSLLQWCEYITQRLSILMLFAFLYNIHCINVYSKHSLDVLFFFNQKLIDMVRSHILGRQFIMRWYITQSTPPHITIMYGYNARYFVIFVHYTGTIGFF